MSSKMQGPEWIELRNFYLAICITSDLFKGCRTQCFGDLSFKIYFLLCFNLIRVKQKISFSRIRENTKIITSSVNDFDFR